MGTAWKRRPPLEWCRGVKNGYRKVYKKFNEKTDSNSGFEHVT